MLSKKILYTLLFLMFNNYAFADNNDEEAIKKALEEITPMKVMKTSEPKIVSEVLVTDTVKPVTKPQTKPPKKQVKKSTKKTTKKSYKKKIIKKTTKPKEEITDFSKLKDVETLGVVSQSKPFVLEQ